MNSVTTMTQPGPDPVRDDDGARPEYPSGVPHKFAPDGTVQPFAGNTILCRVPPTSPLYESLFELHTKLAASEFAPLLALLPPESWHMAVFEGVCDQNRAPGYWPAHIATLKYCTSLFATRLRTFRLQQGKPPYRLHATGFEPLEAGIAVSLSGKSMMEDRRIRDVRDRLADVLEIRHPNHDDYGFHVDVAYLLRHLSDEQEAGLTALLAAHWEKVPKEIEVETVPEFCAFSDVASFEHLSYLGEKE